MECPHLEDHVINIKSDLQKVFKAEKKWFCSGGWLVKVLLRHTRNTAQKYFGHGRPQKFFQRGAKSPTL